MDALEIRLLGGLQLHLGGRPLNPIPQRAARSLFAFLVVNRDRPHTRDLLAGTFWPQLPDARARRRLSQAMWQMQASLPDLKGQDQRLVLAASDAVRLNPDAAIWVDVEQFELLLREAEAAAHSSVSQEIQVLEAATCLYRGDLLDGFYDEWAVQDRERLRERFMTALQRLAHLNMSRGDYEDALVHARRLARHDPFREEAHQQVMRLAALLGRHNDAIRQYNLFRRILADELHARPSPVTDEILKAAVLQRSSMHGRPSATAAAGRTTRDEHPPFLGREQERSTILQVLEAALASRGGLVLVEGETGVGKTCLLGKVAEDAAWRGMDVLWGTALERGGRAYAPLTEALISGLGPLRAQQLKQRLEPVWQKQLGQLIPGLGPSSHITLPVDARLQPVEDQSRMREAICLGITTLADICPLVLVLDDTHWADEDTIRALACLAGRTNRHRFVVAVGYRPAEALDHPRVWELLCSLDRQPSCTRVSLGPLSATETESLIRHGLGLPRVDSDLLNEIVERTAGVPLFVIELVRALHEQGHLQQTAPPSMSSTLIDRSLLTAKLHALLRGRLTGLPRDARTVLDVISVHHGDLSLPEIADASQLRYSAVLHAIDHLARRRLIAEHSDRYHFCHEVMRRLVYDGLRKALRLGLHRRVGLAIERSRPDEVEVLAHHFATAEMPDRAAHYLEQAAERAISVSAFDTAAHQLGQATKAVDAMAGPPEQHFRIAARLEQVLDILGRRGEQGEALDRMQHCASSDDITDVSRRRAWWLAHQDRFAEAETEACRAVECARGGDNRGKVVAALSTLGMIACLAGRAAEGVHYLEEAASFRGADLRQQADARNALGQNLLDLQRFDEAEPQLLAALALYYELHDDRGQAEALGMLGTLRMERGEHNLAEGAILRAIEASRLIGYRYGEAVYRMNLGILYALVDKPQSALQAFDEAAATYTMMGNRRGQALVLSNAAWLRHAVIGSDALAERDATQALSVYREIGDIRGEAQCLATIGSIRYRSADQDRGCVRFQQALDRAQVAKDSWIEAQILKEWAHCELQAGLVEQGLAHVEAALQLCLAVGMHDLGTSTRALQGRLLLESHRNDEALAATTEALQGLRAGVERSYLVPFAHGLALAASGHRTDADHYLELAYQQLLTLLGDLPEPDQKAALTSVPAHRSVVDAWIARRPTQANCRLARIGAPANRPLADDEYATITWTTHSPNDLEIREPISRRHHRLLRLMSEAVAQGAAPTVLDLAKALDVSVSTTRRDLSVLRRQGHRIMTRGARSPLRDPHPGP